MTIKHVKNYQNKLFFVPNLGVKTTKNRNVRSLCAPGASQLLSKNSPLMDHIAGILRVVSLVLLPAKSPLVHENIHAASPYCYQEASIFQYSHASYDPRKNCRQYYIFYKSNYSPSRIYFLIDLTISVNFFKPFVCSSNVPITSPSAPALIMEFAVFAVLIPPQPSETHQRLSLPLRPFPA